MPQSQLTERCQSKRRSASNFNFQGRRGDGDAGRAGTAALFDKRHSSEELDQADEGRLQLGGDEEHHVIGGARAGEESEQWHRLKVRRPGLAVNRLCISPGVCSYGGAGGAR